MDASELSSPVGGAIWRAGWCCPGHAKKQAGLRWPLALVTSDGKHTGCCCMVAGMGWRGSVFAVSQFAHCHCRWAGLASSGPAVAAAELHVVAERRMRDHGQRDEAGADRTGGERLTIPQGIGACTESCPPLRGGPRYSRGRQSPLTMGAATECAAIVNASPLTAHTLPVRPPVVVEASWTRTWGARMGGSPARQPSRHGSVDQFTAAVGGSLCTLVTDPHQGWASPIRAAAEGCVSQGLQRWWVEGGTVTLGRSLQRELEVRHVKIPRL